MEKLRPETPSKAWLLLPAMMIAAAALRVYGITHESLWWDEYASHAHLNAPSLLEFLQLNRTLDPLTLPFYYVFEYLWAHYIHDAVLSLRLLSIAIGVATLPFIYLLGKRTHSAGAGYAAALLLALSPAHIHHSQGIRMYVMFVFLAAAAVWTFMLLLETQRRCWWLAHGLMFLFLYWTHPFAGLLTAALGLFLLLNLRAYRAFFFRWTCMQALLIGPSAAYLASVRFWPQDTTSDWIAYPSLLALASDIFFDDISAFHWQFRLGPVAQRLILFRLSLDLLLAVLILALLVYLGIRLFSRRQQDRAARQRFMLLCVWLALPPVVLFALSWTVRPCMFPRYTVHCMLALYLLLGWATQSFPWPRFRQISVAALALLTLLQWAWLQPGPQRTDWRSAGLLLHEQTAPGDVVLVESMLWRDVFTHNLEHLTPGLLDAPVAAAEKTPALAAQCALCLGMMSRQQTGTDAGRVWAVISLDYFEPGPPRTFETCLREWGVPFERWFFPAIREVYVYRMDAMDADELPSTMEALFARRGLVEPGAEDREGDIDHHTMQAFGDLGAELARAGRTAMARDILAGLFAESAFGRQIYGNLLRAIETGHDVERRASAVRALWDGYGHRNNGQFAHARRAFAEAVLLDPGHVIANFELGVELAGVGDYEGAWRALAKTCEIDAAYGDMLKSLLDALEAREDVPGKLDAVVAYRHGLMALGQGNAEEAERQLRSAVALDPGLAAAHLMLGYVLTLHDAHAGAEAALERYLDSSDAPDVDAYAHMALIQAEQGRADLVRDTLTRLFTRNPTARNVYGSLLDAVEQGGDLQRAAASIRAVWDGFEFRRKERSDSARAAFTRAAALNPDNTFANLELGLELAAAEDKEGAHEALRRAGEQAPVYGSMLRYLLGDLAHNRESKDSLEAVRAYRRGLQAQSQGRYDEAVRYLDQAIAADPRLDDAHTSRVFVLTVQRRIDEAFDGIQRYLDLADAPEPGAFGLLAVLYLARQEPEKAREAARHAVAMDEAYAEQFGPMFHALLEEGNQEKFIKAMDALKSRGIDLYPLMYDFSLAYLKKTATPG